jgi:hypothetical protein
MRAGKAKKRHTASREQAQQTTGLFQDLLEDIDDFLRITADSYLLQSVGVR